MPRRRALTEAQLENLLTCPPRSVPPEMRVRWLNGREGWMARKPPKPEEIVAKLRQVEVLVGQDKPVADAVRMIGVTEATSYRWRAECGGLKLDQVKRLKVLEQENGRLRRACVEHVSAKLDVSE